jgi:hypothetical protein
MSLLGWPAAALALLPAPFGRPRPAPTAAAAVPPPGDDRASPPATTAEAGFNDSRVAADGVLANATDVDAAELAALESIFSKTSRRQRGWHTVEPGKGGHRIYYVRVSPPLPSCEART